MLPRPIGNTPGVYRFRSFKFLCLPHWNDQERYKRSQLILVTLR
jgi:hypothetical protein